MLIRITNFEQKNVMLTRIRIVDEKKPIQKQWILMTFDDFFLLTTSANVTKSNVFGRKNIKNALVFKCFLYCDVSMVYTRFGGFSRRSIFQHSMHGDLRSDQKGMLIKVSEEQMQPSEFCKKVSDDRNRQGCAI